MIYYAVVYMKDGQIHIKPFLSPEDANASIERLKIHPKWGSMIEHSYVITKDTNSETYQKKKGYWVR